MKKLLCVWGCLALAAAAQAGVRAQLRQGGQFYQEQKYGSALNSYNAVLKKHPQDARALFNAGDAYYRLNEYTQAQEVYQKAAQLDSPYRQDALYNLGNAYYRAGDKAKAIESYKAAVRANPQDKEAVHNLQLVWQEKQQDQDNQNHNQNQDNSSDNQDQQDKQNQGQAPQSAQPQNNAGQMDRSDAERVLSMAKENEYKRAPSNAAPPAQTVEKDW